MEQHPEFTSVIEPDGDWFVAVCPELDIASQGRTPEEARRNLAEAVELFMEVADAKEIQHRLSRNILPC